MQVVERLVDDTVALRAHLHDGEHYAARGFLPFGFDPAHQRAHDLVGRFLGVRREGYVRLGHLDRGEGEGLVGDRRFLEDGVLHVVLPRELEDVGVGLGDLAVVEHDDMVGIHIEAGHREVGRAGQHRSGALFVRDDEALVVRIASEVAAQDRLLRLVGFPEKLLERVLGRCPGFLAGRVQRRVVEDHTDASLLGHLDQRLREVRFAEIVGEDIEMQRLVADDLVEDFEEAVLCGEAQPFVFLLVGIGLAFGVLASLDGGIENQARLWRLDPHLRAEMVDESLALREAAREARRQAALDEGLDRDVEGNAELGIDRQQRSRTVEVSRRHGIGVGAEEGF